VSGFLAAMLLQTLVHTTHSEATPVPLSPTERIANSEANAYPADRDAKADVETALAVANDSGKTVVIIMGANWCHDSVDLAGWLNKPRFVDLMRDRYTVVYIDVGTPQTGEGRNLDISTGFGIKKVKSTPVVMLVSASGKLLNSKKDAVSWRNAASRSESDVYRYFAEFAPPAK
jgi:Thioredoxin-like